MNSLAVSFRLTGCGMARRASRVRRRLLTLSRSCDSGLIPLDVGCALFVDLDCEALVVYAFAYPEPSAGAWAEDDGAKLGLGFHLVAESVLHCEDVGEDVYSLLIRAQLRLC